MSNALAVILAIISTSVLSIVVITIIKHGNKLYDLIMGMVIHMYLLSVPILVTWVLYLLFKNI